MVQTDRWREGYGVLISYQYAESSKEEYAVYGVIPEDEQWRIEKTNVVGRDERFRYGTICRLLAEGLGECP